jgi:hypothetical protein
VDLERFFDAMYGTAEGWTYSATKAPNSGKFSQYFFQWPKEREKLIAHCLAYTDTQEVYYAPALFNKPSGKKEDFLGTYWVYCDFDGNAPDSIEGLPTPSIKVQSSEHSHQHWYWRLDHLETDPSVVEAISQKIAYHAKADLSGWDANQVLRPPGTMHHDSRKTVRVLHMEVRPAPLQSFDVLPELPFKLATEEDLKEEIPPPLWVLMKHTFTDEEREFFLTKTIQKGQRSSAMTKFAHICMEKHLSNVETLSLLLNLDERWGKFKNRRDRNQRLLGLINHVRALHPVDPVVEEVTERAFKVYTWDEFLSSEVELEWVIPNLVHKSGSVIVAGPPGTGKSQISFRFAERIAKGEGFLKWEVEAPLKVLVVSMEMPFEELKKMSKDMNLGQDERLQENLYISAPGHSVKLNDKKKQGDLNRIIEEFRPDGVIFDSLGMAVNDDMSSDKIILETFDYINGTIRGEYGCFAWFIHHNRKAQIGNKKPNKLDDLYGNQYIGANITTGIGLYKSGPHIEVSCLKLRSAEEFHPFRIKRLPNLDFEIITSFSEGSIAGSLEDVGDLGDSM